MAVGTKLVASARRVAREETVPAIEVTVTCVDR